MTTTPTTTETQQPRRQIRKSHGSRHYNLLETLPDDAFPIKKYGNHEFNCYYYSPGSRTFYCFTHGGQYRELDVNLHRYSHRNYVYAYDIDGKQTHIFIDKFLRDNKLT